MKRPFLTLILILSCLLFQFAIGHAENGVVPVEVRRLAERPIDTIDAERIRVWVPVEAAYTCKVEVSIYDSTGQQVCFFLNSMLQKGYYNFYWDKKDSLGKYVEPGNYTYTGKVCNRKLGGKLKVQYSKWEKYCQIEKRDSIPNPEFDLKLDKDSALVTVDIFFRGGRLADSLCHDSLFMAGTHLLKWVPKLNLPSNRYIASFKVGDFRYETEFWLKP